MKYFILLIRGQVATLSTHPCGCRVIQRTLEHCSDDEETRCIINEILESAFALAHDQYGNYVTQHVLERGEPDGRRKITEKLTGNVVQMSQHKYAYATHPTLWRSAWNMLIAPRELLTEDHIHINF
ncbi:Pumilio-like protein 5 [Raphanus sativus]|nr:Pumilio-like protein 5 [Raphanus sativus]